MENNIQIHEETCALILKEPSMIEKVQIQSELAKYMNILVFIMNVKNREEFYDSVGNCNVEIMGVRIPSLYIVTSGEFNTFRQRLVKELTDEISRLDMMID